MTARRFLPIVGYALGGAVVVSVLSSLQRSVMGVAPFVATGYVVPVLAGGIAGILRKGYSGRLW